ncbi:uncharacterized protein FFB20_05500 [Fusarium fujikuroi]|nr:hypothetical protein CEK27_012317 [Fusarium fujikuroi]QGI85563.1 hypothetical protein CEK25_012292 [Fusarium fujikuroi]SCN77272.1 uncharacterized protein FFB20_05500 [Fusarium fujikuroi]SCO20050.1 uncharacterized protein FFE2_14552 [Fusarium fujikuroi]SCO24806.1 uncharacterized protein FFC1_15206 [Fusarium fujikuroi]
MTYSMVVFKLTSVGRKIGCDRATPSCNNCIRTQRKCLGYGLQLLWPDRHDGRRRKRDPAEHRPPATPSGSVYYGKYFLNTSMSDIDIAFTNSGGHMLVDLFRQRPRRSLTLHGPLLDRAGMLLGYYQNIISPMISTTQAQNGFCSTLLPMALSSQDNSALALLNAMIAVAMIHYSNSIADAMSFKLKAVRNLSISLASSTRSKCASTNQVQLAAVMMLCVYDVFDREEHNWHIHLNGAKEIIRRQCTDTPGSSSDFLLTWWLYHDVLAAFNYPSWRLNESPGSVSTSALCAFSGDKFLIVGSLGCSVEVLEIIDEINMMRLHSAQDCLSTSTLQRCDLAMKLYNLRQLVAPIECSDSLRSHRILAIAELYRLAALLYLQRVHSIAEDDFTRPAYVQQALGILKSLDVATSPWPVFIIACEVDEQDRVSILHTLDRMDSVRSIGNIKVLRDIIKGIWKQQDLRSIGKAGQRVDWLQFVEGDVPVPWFI